MNITFNSYSKYKSPIAPAFTSNVRMFKTKDGLNMANVTCTFRKNLNWEDFAKFEIENFKNKDKVNIIQFASSDGSEAYTQIMSLLEKGGNKSTKKFFPIIAYDIDDTIVNIARTGLLNLGDEDKLKIEKNCNKFHKYFSKFNTNLNFSFNIYNPLNISPSLDYSTYKVAPTLTNKVCFNIGDIFQIAPKIKDDSNTIILCRNMLSYFPKEKILNVVKAFSQNLKTGSLIATGILEKNTVNYFLREYGFEEIMQNVFRKI